MNTAGLFSGVGGMEKGLELAGFETEFLCEIAPPAQAVLRAHFPSAQLESDVTQLRFLPKAEILTAGFPCQDLSQAGTTRGIAGPKSGLVGNIFRLLRQTANPPKWVILENVPFMLHLAKGEAMAYLIQELEAIGYRWAYRVIDARSFGLPQRRRRVILLASPTEDPVPPLLGENAPTPKFNPHSTAAGFYWTEGNTGLGWTDDGVPTLKSGSTVGIPSPPAIWLKAERRIVTPDIRDAERLQGLLPDWTLPAEQFVGRKRVRWSLVGNSVSVPIFQWLGTRLRLDLQRLAPNGSSADLSCGWPTAAWGESGEVIAAAVSEFPKLSHYTNLDHFLQFPTYDLSLRAANGFLGRARASQLHFPDGFIRDIEHHIKMSNERLSESRRNINTAYSIGMR